VIDANPVMAYAVAGFFMHIKRGITREDGMVFWGFCGKNPDGTPFQYWVTRDVFDKNLSKSKDRLRARYASRKEEYSKIQREYRIKNADVIRERRRRYRSQNAAKIKASKQTYAANNREKISKALAERRANNPIARMANSMRRSIRRYLDAGQKGEMSSFEIIGCSKDHLREYLQSKFAEGMTWDNYGKHWHIDHIVPLASARTVEDVKRLCRWTNLQPLTAFENISKGSKIPVAQVSP